MHRACIHVACYRFLSCSLQTGRPVSQPDRQPDSQTASRISVCLSRCGMRTAVWRRRSTCPSRLPGTASPRTYLKSYPESHPGTWPGSLPEYSSRTPPPSSLGSSLSALRTHHRHCINHPERNNCVSRSAPSPLFSKLHGIPTSPWTLPPLGDRLVEAIITVVTRRLAQPFPSPEAETGLSIWTRLLLSSGPHLIPTLISSASL